MNISSLIVQTTPKYLDNVINSLESLCDIHFQDKLGRIVVTIEGKDSHDESDKMKAIQQIEHVLSVDMVYAYSEMELNESRDKIEEMNSDVPTVLADEKIKAENIHYGGDLKRRP